MSEVKRYDGRVGHVADGNYVSYKDYAALQQKLDLADRACASYFCQEIELQRRMGDLAAENAALKSIVEPISNLSQYGDIVAEMSEALRPHEVDGFVSLFSRARHIETPATDAYLNAVRAEGVEMFADLTTSIGEEEQSETVIYAGKQAQLFAAQLRSQEAK